MVKQFVTRTEPGAEERGASVIEVLVSIFVIGIIFAGLVQQYSSAAKTSRDHSLRIATQAQAQAILQTFISELRVLGNGVPFDQANFQIAEDTLTDPSVTEPIQVATATTDYIAFRLNETGEVHLLTKDFNPASGLTIHLTDTVGLDVGDPIYLNNSVVGGDDGLYGIIQSVNHNAKTVTIAGSYVGSPGGVFGTGSILEEVPLIKYTSPEDGSGITRDSGYGSVLMAPSSTMHLTYIDFNGSEISLPLTNQTVVDQLRSIRVRITLTSLQTLSNGEPYTASIEQTVGLRNLNYVF